MRFAPIAACSECGLLARPALESKSTATCGDNCDSCGSWVEGCNVYGDFSAWFRPLGLTPSRRWLKVVQVDPVGEDEPTRWSISNQADRRTAVAALKLRQSREMPSVVKAPRRSSMRPRALVSCDSCGAVCLPTIAGFDSGRRPRLVCDACLAAPKPMTRLPGRIVKVGDRLRVDMWAYDMLRAEENEAIAATISALGGAPETIPAETINVTYTGGGFASGVVQYVSAPIRTKPLRARRPRPERKPPSVLDAPARLITFD